MERFDERMCCSWDADDVVLEQPRVWQPRALESKHRKSENVVLGPLYATSNSC